MVMEARQFDLTWTPHFPVLRSQLFRPIDKTKPTLVGGSPLFLSFRFTSSSFSLLL